ncbi:hypothetical protein Tco_0281148 [Tanacetum coccineum]
MMDWLLWKALSLIRRDVLSSRSENDTHTDDADINSVNDNNMNEEKVFTNAALKNELRKIKGTSVDTKLTKSSTLGKPVLQPHRNQLVVRQPNAFKSERPRFSKPTFASQVDVKYDLPKSVTPHYLPIVRDLVLEKPHHMIAPGSSRDISKESYALIDMTHKYYLEEAKKKTQERDRKSTTSVMPSAKLHDTTKSCKLKPKSNNQTSRSLPTSKSSCPSITAMPKVLTGNKFTSSTTKVDCEPPNGSTEDITNPYECNQTLNVSAGTLNLNVQRNQGFKEFIFDEQEQWRLQTTLQAPFLKEKKGVRFSALYLQKKRNLLVFDHSHQQ